MTSIKTARTGEGRKRFIVSGAVLLVVGAVGIATVLTILAIMPEDGVDGQVRGTAQSVGVLITGLAVGVGILLLSVGMMKRRRSVSGTPERSSDDPHPLARGEG